MRFDPFTPDAIEDPYRQYAEFRAHDPVHWSEKLRSWVLFRHDDVTAFFRDDVRLSADRSKAAKFKSAAMADQGPKVRHVSLDPPEHVPVRWILNTTLNPRVRTVGPRVDELVRILLDRVGTAVARVVDRAELAGECDLIATFAYPLPINVIAELFDVPEADRPQFRDWSHDVARGMDRFYSGDAFTRGLSAFHEYFGRLVRERRGLAGDDLVRRLLVADHRGEQLSEPEVVTMCSGLVFAGHETTVNLIGNGLLALLRRPDQLARLQADPALIETALEELLRFDSPAQFMSRTAVANFELRGKHIEPEQAVLAGIGSANHDPEIFDDPGRLDVARDPNPHLAFGLGTHFCPGAQLSRIEAQAAISALLRRFPRIRLGDTPPVHRKTAVLRGLEHLPVRVD